MLIRIALPTAPGQKIPDQKEFHLDKEAGADLGTKNNHKDLQQEVAHGEGGRQCMDKKESQSTASA